MLEKLREFGSSIKREIRVYHRALRHPKTPWPAKALLWLSLTYAISPLDIIPDFIPVLGQVDDLLIVPGLVMLALKMIPPEVIEECRAQIKDESPT